MSTLLTTNAVALEALMNETLFAVGYTASAAEAEEAVSGFQQADPQRLETDSGNISTPAVAEEFIYEGSLQRGIVFILRYPDYAYFSSGGREAFERSLSAVGLQPGDVAVVNLANAHNPNDFKRIMAFFKPVKVALLGVDPASLRLPAIPLNEFIKGKVATVFNTFSFEDMFVDLHKKKAFWLQFKQFMTTA